MDTIFILIFLPALVGVFLFIFPEKLRLAAGILAFATSVMSFVYAIKLYQSNDQLISWNLSFNGSEGIVGQWIHSMDRYFMFEIDPLSKLIVLFIGIFSVLIVLYSLFYITKEKKISNYYSYFIITLGASGGLLD